MNPLNYSKAKLNEIFADVKMPILLKNNLTETGWFNQNKTSC